MKKLAVFLAAVITIALTGCGTDSTPSQLAYVARSSSDSWAPHAFVLNPTTQKATAVAIPIPTNAGFVSIDSTATKVVYGRSDDAGIDIYLMGTDGKEVQLTTDGNSQNPVFSPDGKTVAYTNQWYGFEQIATVNTDGTNQKVLYASGSSYYQFFPAFSPDGKSLTFYIELAGANSASQHGLASGQASHQTQVRNTFRNNVTRHLTGSQASGLSQNGWYVMALTDTAPTLVYSPSDWWGPASFSADGKKLLFTDYDGTEWNVSSVNLDGSGVTELTSSTDLPDLAPVAYKGVITFNRINNTNSSWDIYVMDQTGGSPTLVHSTASTDENLVDTYWEED